MRGIRICILALSELSREGLASILSGATFQVEEGIITADQIGEADEQTLILVECGADDAAAPAELAALRERFPKSRIVALVDPRDLCLLMDCYAAPVDGVVSSNVSGTVLLSMLQLAMAGEKVLPAEMLSRMIEKKFVEDRRNTRPDGAMPILTERETQILQLLAGGGSNKSIARHLGSAEATVKVHMTSILRKIDARNRTQAALWAIGNGIDPSEMGASSIGNTVSGVQGQRQPHLRHPSPAGRAGWSTARQPRHGIL